MQLSGTELSRQVQSAADSLLNAQLSMSDTQKQMENYTITSPISGTVIQKNVKLVTLWAPILQPARRCAPSTT